MNQHDQDTSEEAEKIQAFVAPCFFRMHIVDLITRRANWMDMGYASYSDIILMMQKTHLSLNDCYNAEQQRHGHHHYHLLGHIGCIVTQDLSRELDSMFGKTMELRYHSIVESINQDISKHGFLEGYEVLIMKNMFKCWISKYDLISLYMAQDFDETGQ